MRLSLLGRFLLVAIVALLCLMPLWYFFCADLLAAPVFTMAGEIFGSLFHWVRSYERHGTTGVLFTQLKVFGPQGVGLLTPQVDYRMLGYGMVLLWAVLLASLSRGWWRKLILGSLAMLPLQTLSVCVQWLNDVANRAGKDVLAQSRLPQWVAEAAAFAFHFNLFIFTALAPVLLWLLLDRAFIERLWAEMRASASAVPVKDRMSPDA